MEDEVIARLHRIYKQVSADFGNENCFLTGSMAVYFLAKQLSVNNRGLIPNDVDILVNSSYDFISRGPPQKSIKYNAGTDDEYDVIRTRRKNTGIRVQSKHADETLYINVQKLKLIKDEYEDQKEVVEDTRKLLRINNNIAILEEVESRLENIKYEEVPKKKREKRKKDHVVKELKF